jgi:hypothetical protein
MVYDARAEIQNVLGLELRKKREPPANTLQLLTGCMVPRRVKMLILLKDIMSVFLVGFKSPLWISIREMAETKLSHRS